MNDSKTKKILFALILLVLVIFAVFSFQKMKKEKDTLPDSLQNTVASDESRANRNTEIPAGTVMEDGVETNTGASPNTTPEPSAIQETKEVREFVVLGNNFSFSPAVLAVKKGDRVRIVFKNQDGVHDWVLDEFHAATKKIRGGETETIEFVADKAGTFEYYCSIGSHRAMGMKGTLTVTE